MCKVKYSYFSSSQKIEDTLKPKEEESMTTRRIFAKTLLAVCLFALAGLSAMHKAGQARAQITPESLPCPTCRFGMVGITRGQTIRLNVVNSADIPPGPCRTISEDVPPGPCRQRVD